MELTAGTQLTVVFQQVFHGALPAEMELDVPAGIATAGDYVVTKQRLTGISHRFGVQWAAEDARSQRHVLLQGARLGPDHWDSARHGFLGDEAERFACAGMQHRIAAGQDAGHLDRKSVV